MEKCLLCPRMCGVNRSTGQYGYCGEDAGIYIARASLHMWEEPCISGESGSGTVFFEGCNMRCVYCQNYKISDGRQKKRENMGRIVDEEQLADIFLTLQKKGAMNINLVTPTHYTPQLCVAILIAKEKGLKIPVIYNCSGYERVETLRSLEGLIDIYMPDFKYIDEKRAKLYSNAEDYPEVAKKAIFEMHRQIPKIVWDEESGMMKRGIIVRHLVLPDTNRDTKKILRYLHENYGDSIYISLMNQYTPIISQLKKYPILQQRVLQKQYDKCVEFADKLGIVNCFIQEGEAAMESFIPEFYGEE